MLEAVIVRLRYKVIEQFKAFGAVIVIGIDYHKRTFDNVSAAPYCMTRSIGLHSALGYTVALGKCIELLENVIHLYFFCYSVSYKLFEYVLDLVLDYENYSFKARLYCVVNRIIDYKLA